MTKAEKLLKLTDEDKSQNVREALLSRNALVELLTRALHREGLIVKAKGLMIKILDKKGKELANLEYT